MFCCQPSTQTEQTARGNTLNESCIYRYRWGEKAVKIDRPHADPGHAHSVSIASPRVIRKSLNLAFLQIYGRRQLTHA